MPRTVTTSMRLADGMSATLAFNVDLGRAQAAALKSIDHAARSSGSLKVLQLAVARIMGELAVREADLKRFDNDRRARITATIYADELEGDGTEGLPPAATVCQGRLPF